MPHFSFPCNYVYWENIKEHDKLKNDILPFVYKLQKESLKNPFKMCRMSTNFGHKSNESKFLTEYQINELVWKPINNMINELKNAHNFHIKPGKSILQYYWFNSYKEGDFQEMHNHTSPSINYEGQQFHPSFSIVYILNDDNNENKTTFVDFPYGNVPFGYPSSQSFYTSGVKDIKEGSVIIFSPFLQHCVGPVKKDGRITLAFNVFSTY
jgi:predicted 2-oxoglutarate/Fe(II)-dependent dioxygenase YbiX